MTTLSLVNILDLVPEELRAKFTELGFDAYRADQVMNWIYSKGVYDFDRMSNLPALLREKIKKSFTIVVPEEAECQKSHEDKSVKLLLKLTTGDYVETVLMSFRDRVTVCVSSQVGCKFHCAFCASGQNGFFKNLTAGEIVSQVLKARDLAPDKKITHIVLMGIGEPLDNYAHVLKAIRILNSPKTLQIGARRITVSTCGVVPKIEKLNQEGLQIELSVSLHGPNDEVRQKMMPINRRYPVARLMEVCREYIEKTNRAITFEYILAKDVNASPREARLLTKLLSGMLCKVNLIPLNPIQEFPYKAPSYPEIVLFQKILTSAKIKTTVRFSKGQDIQAACGQLRSVKIGGRSKVEGRGRGEI